MQKGDGTRPPGPARPRLLSAGWHKAPGTTGNWGTRCSRSKPVSRGPSVRTGCSAYFGAGGMGRVYLGRSAGGRTVAVKIVHPHFASDEEFRARFRREVEAARRVGGEWTAPVLDADPGAPVPWVATGYVVSPSWTGRWPRTGRSPRPPYGPSARGWPAPWWPCTGWASSTVT